MTRRILLPLFALWLAACSAAPVPTAAPGTAAPAVPSPTDRPAATATATLLPPDLPAVSAPALVRVDFLDSRSGWAVAAADKGYLLRTVDGGRTWLNAAPPQAGPLGSSTGFFVLDNQNAWLLPAGSDFYNAVLYQTHDGGLTWTSNPVPFDWAQLQFLDARTGRALAGRGLAAGSEAVELFQTSDGGVTWTSIFHNNPTVAGASDSLPFSGIKNGMVFTDASTGWVTGSRPAPGDVYLFVTHDGGVNWIQPPLPLPAGGEANQYVTESPVFFGSDGLLPVRVYTPDGKVVQTFYVTHDGGASWSGDPSDGRRTVPPGLTACADALHIWVWDGGATIYSSQDGGQTWSGTAASPALGGRLAQLEFVPSVSGAFVGWALTVPDEGGPASLYRSDDNGIHWTAVTP